MSQSSTSDRDRSSKFFARRQRRRVRRTCALRKGPQARRLLLESLEDRRLLATDLISIVPPELGADTGNSTCSTPSICAAGRFVAFESSASNLVVADTNGLQDIFVRDTQAGITTRISLDGDGNQANGESYAPTISADGRFVAFESSASNLVVADTNGAPDIFVRDTQTGTTRRVSLDSDGTQAYNGSFFAAISGDGRYVTFQSDASNLVSGDTNGARDIFVKDLQTGVTTRVSTDSSGTQANDSSYSPAISGDGRYVAFQSSANNLASSTADRDLDPFDGDALDAEWTFDTNGDFGPQYSLTTRPDWLRISVPAYHDIWYNNRDGAPLLYTGASDYPASFSLETLVEFGTGNLGAIPMWGTPGSWFAIRATPRPTRLR